ncbi:hypothetical protein H7U20_10140 [Rugamonas sp. CCM 8940]|nr:hypothetical protein [Rugamonas sp. CCM 8940]
MSVTSTYTFLQGFFNGLFTVHNTAQAADQPFSRTFPNSSTMVLHRPNGEMLVDLGTLINTNENVGLVSKRLMSAGGAMTSELRVQGVQWASVPYFMQSPAAHMPMDMLTKVNFDFHIETPFGCTDVDGTISVFLFLFIDAQKHLQVRVDGTWLHVDGGGFCHAPAFNALKAAMPGVRQQVADLLPGLMAVTKNLKFNNLYYMPGNGFKAAGIAAQNASVDTAIGLISA